mgnify:CR=1 FL=1
MRRFSAILVTVFALLSGAVTGAMLRASAIGGGSNAGDLFVFVGHSLTIVLAGYAGWLFWRNPFAILIGVVIGVGLPRFLGQFIPLQ